MNKHDATIYLKGIKDFYGLDKDSEEAIDVAIELLSAERTGEWQASINGTDYRVCSACGYERHAGTKYNYCPNCGAKMGGDTE